MGVMRLYCKLFVMILLCAALQHYAPPSEWGGDAWFATRCHAAALLGDKKLAEQMVDEYYYKHRSINIEEWEEENGEVEFHLAAAG